MILTTLPKLETLIRKRFAIYRDVSWRDIRYTHKDKIQKLVSRSVKWTKKEKKREKKKKEEKEINENQEKNNTSFKMHKQKNVVRKIREIRERKVKENSRIK